MGKLATSVSIIGGADGPTSVFLVGSKHKDKNLFRRIKHKLINRKYKKKRALAEKSIVPSMHTMEETIQYMKQQYAASEAGTSYQFYEKRKADMKYSLIQRQRPELLGEEIKLLPPEDFSDKQAVSDWQKNIIALTDECRRKSDLVPHEIFPTDYHLFIINRGDGRLEIEVDTFHQVISVSYSGEKKVMEPILKDIHLYYGVAKEDIEQKTERYQMLVTVLSF